MRAGAGKVTHRNRRAASRRSSEWRARSDGHRHGRRPRRRLRPSSRASSPNGRRLRRGGRRPRHVAGPVATQLAARCAAPESAGARCRAAPRTGSCGRGRPAPAPFRSCCPIPEKWRRCSAAGGGSEIDPLDCGLRAARRYHASSWPRASKAMSSPRRQRMEISRRRSRPRRFGSGRHARRDPGRPARPRRTEPLPPAMGRMAARRGRARCSKKSAGRLPRPRDLAEQVARSSRPWLAQSSFE